MNDEGALLLASRCSLDHPVKGHEHLDVGHSMVGPGNVVEVQERSRLIALSAKNHKTLATVYIVVAVNLL